MEKVITNAYATIMTDVRIETERSTRANRPDLIIKDHQKKAIYIVDVAISHPGGQTVKEQEKIAKYEEVRRDLATKTGYKTTILPYVISWDANVTKANKVTRSILGITQRTHAYIQKITMRETINIIFNEICPQYRETETMEMERMIDAFDSAEEEEENQNREMNIEMNAPFPHIPLQPVQLPLPNPLNQ
eukprot:TRINITY_DN3765_c0_g1_i5.p1 TRINITY_DN3765_c0_g1~~TRINITY_DN3765_c0_g1_i5.p1  ORF type:complete len:190 (+),score=33.25 TRINITY_DN3765_c0_g1_i5:64-633(+)